MINLQLSLVSHYGKKPGDLAKFITLLQDKLSENLLSAFCPYATEQVHGTVIGLETLPVSNGFISKWFEQNKGKAEPVDFKQLLHFLRTGIDDIVIKIGGYRQQKKYPFASRNEHPFIRSFSLNGDIAVTIGWPIKAMNNTNWTDSLYRLRKKFETINFCHKWNKDGYADNDFFFVLGRIDTARTDPSQLEKTSTELRNLLARSDFRITIRKDTLSLVAYLDSQLPLSTTKQYALDNTQLSGDYLNHLCKQKIIDFLKSP